MGVVTDSWLADSLLLVASVLLLFYWYISSTANYFKDRGIPYLRPLPFVGIVQSFTKSQHDLADYLYNNFPDKKYYGYFQVKIPTLLVKDPELIRKVMVKDFGNFHDRGFPIVESDSLSQNLFGLKGLSWRILRQKLMPTFSSGKLKLMFEQILKCGDSLVEEVDKVATSGEPIDVRVCMMNFTTEVIGSTAFGLDFNKNNPQGKEFMSKVKEMFAMSFTQLMRFFFLMIEPRVLEKLKIRSFDEHSTDYFINLVKGTKEYRKKNNIERNDYFQLLLKLQEAEESGKTMTLASAADNNEEDAVINQMEYAPKDSSTEKVQKRLFTDEMITSHSFAFLTAGSESVAGTLNFVFYHLGKDAEIQRRVIKEIDEVLARHNQNWSYQAVKEMIYLDQIIQETQRIYPAVALLLRKCTVPYTLPDSNAVIDKGTIICIPIKAIQNDPKHYPSPEVFNPDRFVDNNYKPNPTYMPFGDGPRICIAMRFAVLEMKVCLAKILAQYNVKVNSKTPEPFTFERKSFFPKSEGGVWINFIKRNGKSV